MIKPEQGGSAYVSMIVDLLVIVSMWISCSAYYPRSHGFNLSLRLASLMYRNQIILEELIDLYTMSGLPVA